MALGSDLLLRLLIKAQDLTGGAVRSAREGIQSISTTAERVYNAVKQYLSFQVSVGGAEKFVKLADAASGIAARLKLATSSQQEYARAQEQTFSIAQLTRSSLESIAGLYARNAQAIKDLGGNQRTSLDLTQAIAQTFKISGASAAESSSGISQLSQALASGVLRGDEFNSVMESSPRLAKALADGLGVPIGQLRKMAEAGELTADKVVNALLSQKDKIASEFGQIPTTVEDAVTQAENELLKFAGELNQRLGITSAMVGIIQTLTGHLGELTAIVGIVGIAIAKNLTAGLANYAVAQVQAIQAGKAQVAQLAAEKAARLESLKTAQTEASIRAKLAAASSAESAARLVAARAALAEASTLKAIRTAYAEMGAAMEDYRGKSAAARTAQQGLTTAQLAYDDELDKVPARAGLAARAINALGQAFNLFQVFLVGFEIGNLLNQFEAVRIAGSYVAEFVTIAVTGLQRMVNQLRGIDTGGSRLDEIAKIHAEYNAIRASSTDAARAEQAAAETAVQGQQQAVQLAQRKAQLDDDAVKAAKSIAEEFAKLDQAGLSSDFTNQIRAVQEQLAGNPQAATDMVEPVKEFVRQAIDLHKQLAEEEKRQAQDVKRSEVQASKEAIQAQIDDVKRLLDAKRNAATEAANAQKDAEAKAANARQSARDIASAGQDKIRELKRRDLTPEAQQTDIAAQANDKLTLAYQKLVQARDAAESGQTDQAEKLANDAQKTAEAAGALGESLTDTKRAIDVVAQASNIAGSAQNAIAQANDGAAAKAKANLEQISAEITALEAKLAGLENQQKAITIAAQTDEAKARIEEIQSQLDALQDKTITVTVNQVASPAATPAPAAHPAVPGFATGIILPGYGGGDRRLSMLEDGEAVLPKESVRAIGHYNVRRLIAGQLPGFSTGGIVAAVSSGLPTGGPAPIAAAAGPAGQPVHLHLPSGQSFELAGAPDVVTALGKAVGREALKFGRRS